LFPPFFQAFSSLPELRDSLTTISAGARCRGARPPERGPIGSESAGLNQTPQAFRSGSIEAIPLSLED
jgi:hypothetical protein